MIGHPWRPFTTRDGDVACADCYLAEQHRIHKANDHAQHRHLAPSGPIRDEAEDWRELWQMTGGEAGSA